MVKSIESTSRRLKKGVRWVRSMIEGFPGKDHRGGRKQGTVELRISTSTVGILTKVSGRKGEEGTARSG